MPGTAAHLLGRLGPAHHQVVTDDRPATDGRAGPAPPDPGQPPDLPTPPAAPRLDFLPEPTRGAE
jgi:hypothetical protein